MGQVRCQTRASNEGCRRSPQNTPWVPGLNRLPARGEPELHATGIISTVTEDERETSRTAAARRGWPSWSLASRTRCPSLAFQLQVLL